MSGLNKNGDSFSVSWIWIFLQLLLFKLFLGGGFGGRVRVARIHAF